MEPGPITDAEPPVKRRDRPEPLQPGEIDGADRPVPQVADAPPGDEGGIDDGPPDPGRQGPAILAGLSLILAFAVYTITATLMDAFARHWGLGVVVAALMAAAGCGVALWLVLEMRGLAGIRNVQRDRARLREGLRLAAPTAFAAQAAKVVAAIGPQYLPRFTELADRERENARILAYADHFVRIGDARAVTVIARAARDVGLGSGFAPTPLIAALIVVLRSMAMVRQVAAGYGHRPGAAGTWLLARRILTGAAVVASVDALSDSFAEITGDLVQELDLPLFGRLPATVLAKLTARSAEGLIGARKAARIGLAAMELCRPLPFSDETRPPSVAAILKAAFSK